MVPLGSILIFWFLLAGLCYGNNKKVEVVGVVECSDCGINNYAQIRQVLSGIHVTIDCKFEAGKYKTMGASKLDDRGKFKVYLPNDVTTKNGKQKQDCFAKLHSPFGAQCANNHNGEKSAKVIFFNKSKGKLTFGLKENLKFPLATCTSAFFWPHFKYPPLHNLPTWPKFHHHPPMELPFSPPPLYESTISPPPPVPVYENFVPPPSPSPVSRPAPTFKKPLSPPPVPIFKQPLPPSIPIQKKPLPPPVPKFRKPSPRPIPPLKKLVPPLAPSFEKPLPPPTPVSSNNPPTPEKSHVIIPKAPPVPSLPQIPSVPRKYFNKPKIGNQPTIPL